MALLCKNRKPIAIKKQSSLIYTVWFGKEKELQG
jgi:hypothetical protein